jgi:tetrahydromethanopterin S-methyltransferase subunit A
VTIDHIEDIEEVDQYLEVVVEADPLVIEEEVAVVVLEEDKY